MENYNTLKTFHFYNPPTISPGMIKNFVGLKDLDLRLFTGIYEEEISYFINNIPMAVEKLNLYRMHHMHDYHVKILVERCTNLKRLDISFTSTTEQSLIYICENLNSLEELYWRTSFIIKNGSIVKELLSMPKLKLFTCGYKHKLLTEKKDI